MGIKTSLSISAADNSIPDSRLTHNAHNLSKINGYFASAIMTIKWRTAPPPGG